MTGSTLLHLNTKGGENHLDTFLCPSETSQASHALQDWFMAVKPLPQNRFLRFAFQDVTICLLPVLPFGLSWCVFEIYVIALPLSWYLGYQDIAMLNDWLLGASHHNSPCTHCSPFLHKLTFDGRKKPWATWLAGTIRFSEVYDQSMAIL